MMIDSGEGAKERNFLDHFDQNQFISQISRALSRKIMYAWGFARLTARKHGRLITYFQINRDYSGALYGLRMPKKINPMTKQM
jgi:hypothetical protein